MDPKVEENVEERIEEVEAYKCLECGEIRDESGPVLYECTECGQKFSKDNGLGMGNICPDCCNKFGSRVADESCVECETGEVEIITVYQCCSCSAFYEERSEAESCACRAT